MLGGALKGAFGGFPASGAQLANDGILATGTPEEMQGGNLECDTEASMCSRNTPVHFFSAKTLRPAPQMQSSKFNALGLQDSNSLWGVRVH